MSNAPNHVLEMDKRHRYTCLCGHVSCTGKVFDSVTTILGNAVPKNLAWHGQTRGVIGVKGLLRFHKYNVRSMKPAEILSACKSEGILPEQARAASPGDRSRLAALPKYDLPKMSADDITTALKREHLTVNDHRDDAATGGTVIHKALDDFATKGIIPSASAVPDSKRGSIRGLAKFIIEYRPEFVATEVKVLSTEHCYAGTFDVDARVHAEVYEVPKKGGGVYLKMRPAEKTLRALIDLKTSKWVYPASHFPQLEAYEGARVESGGEATDIRAVLWINANGDMELVPSTATFADFLALKASAEAITRLDKSWSRPRKAKP